jgi:hypothetical protein
MDSNITVILGVAALCVSYLTLVFRTAFQKGLRQVPGPFIARFSGLFRLWLVYDGKAPSKYRKVHREYGPIVRVGPNHVSMSDPEVIPQIYGIGTDFPKVALPDLN